MPVNKGVAGGASIDSPSPGLVDRQSKPLKVRSSRRGREDTVEDMWVRNVKIFPDKSEGKWQFAERDEGLEGENGVQGDK